MGVSYFQSPRVKERYVLKKTSSYFREVSIIYTTFLPLCISKAKDRKISSQVKFSYLFSLTSLTTEPFWVFSKQLTFKKYFNSVIEFRIEHL